MNAFTWVYAGLFGLAVMNAFTWVYAGLFGLAVMILIGSHDLSQLGARIMAKIDDLKAALDGVQTGLAAVVETQAADSAKLTELDVDIKDLIAKLEAAGGGSIDLDIDLDPVIAQAQGISSTVAALQQAATDREAALDALRTQHEV